jgi:hypothetical protein
MVLQLRQYQVRVKTHQLGNQSGAALLGHTSVCQEDGLHGTIVELRSNNIWILAHPSL